MTQRQMDTRTHLNFSFISAWKQQPVKDIIIATEQRLNITMDTYKYHTTRTRLAVKTRKTMMLIVDKEQHPAPNY